MFSTWKVRKPYSTTSGERAVATLNALSKQESKSKSRENSVTWSKPKPKASKWKECIPELCLLARSRAAAICSATKRTRKTNSSNMPLLWTTKMTWKYLQGAANLNIVARVLHCVFLTLASSHLKYWSLPRYPTSLQPMRDETRKMRPYSLRRRWRACRRSYNNLKYRRNRK